MSESSSPRPTVPVTNSKPAKPISVLLGSAAYGGTLAAVRLLGRRGLDVEVVTSRTLSSSAWSRHVSKTHTIPCEKESEAYVDRLLELGKAKPGQVLIATSDDTAWLYALHADRLSNYYQMAAPSIHTMRRILDKWELSQAAERAGLPVLPNWAPRNIDEVIALAPNLPYPMLIKPRTHVHRLLNDKGQIARSAPELIDEYRKIIERERAGTYNQLLHEANLPILQRFVSVAEKGVHSITGFIDKTGELFVTRSATKVFQRSQPAGVGVCFEARPTSPELSEAVRRLCRELNYAGIFEVEFLWCEDKWCAIDFNPRLFGQVALDVRRDMPLPLLACLLATGQQEALRAEVEQARALDKGAPTILYDRFTLQAILLAKSLTGRMRRNEQTHWRAWTKRDAEHVVDIAADEYDVMPGYIHILSEISLGIAAIPRFLRSTARVSAQKQASMNTAAAAASQGRS